VTALLEAHAVTHRYAGAAAPAVDGISVAVERGATLGVVGESGSGKTTLGRLLVGALEPTAGTVLVDGRAWSEVRRTDPARRRVQMVFQDPYGSLNPWRSARDTVAEVAGTWGASRAERGRRAEELLAEVGLPRDAMARTPRELSGGQCQRVGIARALAADPAVLVADEPTSSLDVSVQAQILNLLTRLRDERELALVLISHDLAVVRWATQSALVMYGGRVVEEAATGDLLADPRHPYTRILVDAIPGRDGPLEAAAHQLETSQGCVFARSCPFVADECLTEQPALAERADRRHACIREPTSQPVATVA